MNKYQNLLIFLCGDFNTLPLDSIQSAFNLVPLISVATRYSTILDQFMVCDYLADKFNIPVVGPPIGQSDNNIIYICPKILMTKKTTKISKIVYDLRLSNINAFSNKLHSTDFNDITNADNLDYKVQLFQQHINDALKLIPTRKIYLKEHDKCWITCVTKALIDKRWRAFHKRDFQLYNHYKLKVKQSIAKAKELWFLKHSRFTNNSTIWKFSKEVTTPTDTTFAHYDYLYSKYDSITNAANHIAKDFQTYYNNTYVPNYYIPTQQSGNNNHFDISETDVLTFILKTKLSNICPLSCPAILIKAAANAITSPLTHIYNTSVSQGVFPSCWKVPDKRSPVKKFPRKVVPDKRSPTNGPQRSPIKRSPKYVNVYTHYSLAMLTMNVLPRIFKLQGRKRGKFSLTMDTFCLEELMVASHVVEARDLCRGTFCLGTICRGPFGRDLFSGTT